MRDGYFMFYAEASVVSILIFSLFLHHDFTTTTRTERQVHFDRTLIAFILYFASDACWAGVIGGVIPRNSLTLALPNLANCFLLSLISYQWLRFVAAYENMPQRNLRWVKQGMRLPVEFVSAFMSLTWIISPSLWVSSDGKLKTAYYVMLILLPVIYLTSAFFFSMFKAAKQKNTSIRRRYVRIGAFPMFIILFGVLQTFMLDAPLFCLSCTILMLYFFLEEAKDQISIDQLTGLNNRGQLQRYENQETAKGEGIQLFVIMIDADDFKTINDTYGHAEGDRALILIAETMKASVSSVPSFVFLARYGGDEFVIVVHTDDEAVVKNLIDMIRQGLRERHEKYALPYPLSISSGYAAMNYGDTFRSCMVKADERLYQEKKRLKKGR